MDRLAPQGGLQTVGDMARHPALNPAGGGVSAAGFGPWCCDRGQGDIGLGPASGAAAVMLALRADRLLQAFAAARKAALGL